MKLQVWVIDLFDDENDHPAHPFTTLVTYKLADANPAIVTLLTALASESGTELPHWVGPKKVNPQAILDWANTHIGGGTRFTMQANHRAVHGTTHLRLVDTTDPVAKALKAAKPL